MNIKRIALTVVAATLFLTSCNTDSDLPVYTPRGDYEGGILVVNEGPFGEGTGTITYVSGDFSEKKDNIYNAENGVEIGNILQSMVLYGNQAFLVVNVSNKIEVVNRFTFLRENTIDEHLVNPRYAVVANHKLYVSNWGDTASETDDFIAVFNVETLTHEKDISVVLGPEKMNVVGTKIFIAHEGAWGINNKVSVINTGSDEISSVIEVGEVPNSMGVDSAGNLWVLCGGIPAWTGNETFGSLYMINTIADVVEKTFTFDNAHPDHVTLDGNNVLYAINSDVYGMGANATELPTEVLLTVDTATLYGLRASGNYLFASHYEDYSSKGSLTMYNYMSTELLNTVSVGVGPNAVHFNN
ncbi:MAG: hypothetical protein COB81_02620 [Flavobacteriaceae bacterium]|nr:MAG: hypothetical protein COB81_02620 [Flavobacteriaceae bacterium]